MNSSNKFDTEALWRKDRDHWKFPGSNLSRAHAARRLQRDLEINLAGVALVLDLMEEMMSLRNRIRNQVCEKC